MAWWAGRFSVKGVKADSKDDFMICKLERSNLHGILNVEQGYYVEDVEVEEPIPEDKDEKKDSNVSHLFILILSILLFVSSIYFINTLPGNGHRHKGRGKAKDAKSQEAGPQR